MKKLVFCFSLMAFLLAGQANNLKSTVLPLALQSFSAIYNGEKIELFWKAFNGASSVYFTVEKSKDGKSFTKVIDVPSSGAAICYRDYAEVDYKPYKGKSYYRLKQTDAKGNYQYSATIMVNYALQKKIAGYHLPENITPNLDEKINKHDSQEVVLVLRDAQGVEFVSKVLLMIEKNVVFILDEKKSVPKGNYVITSSSDDSLYNYKLTVR